MRKLYVRDIPRCLKVSGPEVCPSSVSWARHCGTPSPSHGFLRFHLNYNCPRCLQKYTLTERAVRNHVGTPPRPWEENTFLIRDSSEIVLFSRI
jgi:hypothetical protein